MIHRITYTTYQHYIDIQQTYQQTETRVFGAESGGCLTIEQESSHHTSIKDIPHLNTKGT